MKPGLLECVQALLDDALALARTRLELLGTELEEALVRLLLMGIVTLLLTVLAAGFLGAALLFALPEEQRLAGAAGVGVALLAAAMAAGWRLRRRALLFRSHLVLAACAAAGVLAALLGPRRVARWTMAALPVYAWLRRS